MTWIQSIHHNILIKVIFKQSFHQVTIYCSHSGAFFIQYNVASSEILAGGVREPCGNFNEDEACWKKIRVKYVSDDTI